MGGYAIPLGETESYTVYMGFNSSKTSDEFRQFYFYLKEKGTDKYIEFGQWNNERDEDLEKFFKEAEGNLELFNIKDQGLRNKVQFEYKLRQLEEENTRLKSGTAALEERLKNIENLVGRH